MRELSTLKKPLNNFLHSFGFKALTHAGIDIDPTSIVLLQLNRVNDHFELQHLAVEPLPAQTIINDVVDNVSALATAIQNAHQQANVKADFSAIAAPSNLVVTKQIRMSSQVRMGGEEFFAWSEARKAFPRLIDNLYLDFVIQDENSDANNKSSINPGKNMSLITARKKELQTRLEATQKAGLPTKILDVDYYALARAYSLIAPQLPKEHVDQYVAILNIDTSSILMMVMHQNDMVYYHRQSFRGEALTDIVLHHLGLGANSASSADTQVSATHNDQQQLSEEHKRILTTQAQRLIQFFQSENAGASIDRLVLAGRCAVIPQLDMVIQEKTAVPTVITQPFLNMTRSSEASVDINLNLAPAFMLSCGLAMRDTAKIS